MLLREDGATLPALEQARPDGRVAWTLADGYGRPYAAAYHLPAVADGVPAPAPAHGTDAVFGGAVRLLGYSLDTGLPGRGYDLPDTNLAGAGAAIRGLCRFHPPAGRPQSGDGQPTLAGHDGQPDGGRFPTSAWQPGQIILDVHALTVPGDAPRGEYELEAGLYLLATMRRLPASDSAGRPLPDDAAWLGTLRVE